MQNNSPRRPKICMVSSVPVTLWSFYRGLPERLKDDGIGLEICSSAGAELDYFQRQFGVNVHQVNIRRKITPWRDILAILKLVKIFKRNRYDLVHAHTPKAGLLGMIAARLASVRCRVYTCHGLPSETESGLKRKLLVLAERISCALANQVLVVSQSLLNVLREYKICSTAKLTILGNGSACGVDLSRFTLTPELIEKAKAIRREHSISADDTVIGFIGRLVPDKGVHILSESFARLYESNPNVRLLVIGDFEPHRGRLSDKTIEILSNHPGIIQCEFTHQIELYYAAMDILVLPTRREGFPYTILEAAAMGLPVIATKVTGCVDAVVDGQTGLLVPPEDITALTVAMQKLLASPQLRRQMGQESRKRVEEKFTSQRLLNAHVKLYRKMLEIQY
jgi:glycosyltransferase involved in cell wall biosynthesis